MHMHGTRVATSGDDKVPSSISRGLIDRTTDENQTLEDQLGSLIAEYAHFPPARNLNLPHAHMFILCDS